MPYQRCRWYDPYPRLAFALKLLYLAPRAIQRRVFGQLSRSLKGEFGLRTTPSPTFTGNRWYDVSEEATEAIELIRLGPETLKHQSANEMLTMLKQVS